MKKKLLVCGIRFGQFYLEAIQKSEQFELAGILTNGSERSVTCAGLYGVKVYTGMEQLPDDIDMACVVIKTGAFGGQGTTVAKRLMEIGVPVLLEQPIHYQELLECYKTAQQSRVCFRVGNLYDHLPSVAKFTAAAEHIMKYQQPLYVNIDLATQVAYPLAFVLTKLFPKKKRWKVKEKAAGNAPFSLLLLEIGDIPVTIRAQNQVDAVTSDNYMHLFFAITAGFGSGTLALTDIHGAVTWRERMTIPDNMWIPRDLTEDAPINMQSDSIRVLSSGQAGSYQTILTKVWPEAIHRDIEILAEWTENIRARKDMNFCNTITLQAAANWQVLTQAFGYPVVCENTDREYFDIEKVITEEYKTLSMQERYEKLSVDDVRKSVVMLDQACLLSILSEFQKKGVFLPASRWITEQEILVKMDPQTGSDFIIKRWLMALNKHHFIKKEGDSYRYIRNTVAESSVSDVWQKAGVLWSDRLGPPSTADYFYQNALNLRGLLDGTVSANSLLFPEGRDDIANELYSKTLIAWYMNQTIAKTISNYMETNSNVSILEAGAGTGATTEAVFEWLRQQGQDEKPAEYCFTDLSSFFLNEAKAKYGHYDYFDMAVLDLENKADMGKIPSESFDIIVAAGVLNNIKNINTCLALLKQKLKRNGIFMISEATDESLQMLISQVFMMEAAEDSRRISETTFMSGKQWEDVFHKSGLQVLHCYPPSEHKLSWLGQQVFILRKE